MRFTDREGVNVDAAPNRAQRPTIGYVINNRLIEVYGRTVFEGIMDAAEEQDLNLVCYMGRNVDIAAVGLTQNRALLALANSELLDGLITLGLVEEEVLDCIPACTDLPVVSVQRSRFTSITADNYAGMREALDHLLDRHGRKRIAFIRGVKGEPTGEERYLAYVEFLRERGLGYDPALVCEGNFEVSGAEEAVRVLLDERRVAFDALVAANDVMALTAMRMLRARGKHVPDEIAVVGYDDVEDAEISSPPLTTVRQPLYAMARRAVHVLAARLRGETPAGENRLRTELCVRRSCGCFSEAIVEVDAAICDAGPARRRAPKQLELSMLGGAVTTACREVMGELGLVECGDSAQDLYRGLARDLQDETSLDFLSATERLMWSLGARNLPLSLADKVLSKLRQRCLPIVRQHPRAKERAEHLWQKARIFIAETKRRRILQRKAEHDRQDGTLRDVARGLSGRRQASAVTAALATGLRQLGVRSGYLSLYEGAAHPFEWSRLMMAFRDGNDLALPAGGERLRTELVLPSAYMPSARRYTLMVVPIFLDFSSDEQLGYGVFEVNRDTAALCAMLCEQLGTALKGALLFEDISRDVRVRREAEEKLHRELMALLEVVKKVAEGDLTQRGVEGDEIIGRIARPLNGMIISFAAMLREVREAAYSVSTSASQILAAAGEIGRGAQYGSDHIHATSSSVDEMAASMAQVAAGAEMSAARARQMLEHVRESDASVSASHEAMSKIDHAVQETSAKMRRLEERSRKIFEITTVIEGIAKQSKLLSLNAAITAAQAGEVGRGFAVVADEVRRLADSSAQAAKDVAAHVEGIASETTPAIVAMENAMHEVSNGRELSARARKSLVEISSLVQDSTQLAAQIANASREQTQATRTVAEAMQTISNITVESTASSEETSRAVRGLVAMADQLNRAIARFRVDES